MKNYCLAYGRNLDLKRMKEVCPHCKLVGSGVLNDWQLAFKKYITVEPKIGQNVPVGIWEYNKKGEEELDAIEKFPILYRKEYVDILVNGKIEKALVYLINDDTPTYPDDAYFERLLTGYNDFGFDRKYLDEARNRVLKN